MGTLSGVIFDLGSTLIRFRGDWGEVLGEGRRAVADWLRQAGYPLDGDAFSADLDLAFHRNYEDRRRDHRERASRLILTDVLAAYGLRDVSEPDLREALRRLYAPSEACWSAVPGVNDVLQDVAGMGLRIGLLSNASDVDNVGRLMAQAGLDGIFDPVVISAAAGVRKPTPTLFLDIARAWGAPPDRIVMVGDMLAEDILGAQRAGLHQIWVRGEADPAFNDEYMGRIQPEVTVGSLRDIPRAIEALGA
jgi:putative hydrolase of the HAD superfamily